MSSTRLRAASTSARAWSSSRTFLLTDSASRLVVSMVVASLLASLWRAASFSLRPRGARVCGAVSSIQLAGRRHGRRGRGACLNLDGRHALGEALALGEQRVEVVVDGALLVGQLAQHGLHHGHVGDTLHLVDRRQHRSRSRSCS